MEQQQRADDPCTSEEEHPCTCCELVFPTAERLAVHAKVHRGGPRRPFKCPECCRTFLRTEKLRAHQLVHRVGKPHKCELCPKAFTYKKTLLDHLLRHTGVRPYQCDLCPQSFYTSPKLADHRIRHTGERPFKCRVCDRRFAGRAEQLSHERTHDGDRPYHCPVCKRSFGRNSILERHMMRHTGERPYKCHLCPNTFTRLYQLLEHCKDHPQPQSSIGNVTKRRDIRKRSRQRRTASRAAAATASVVPGGSPSSISPSSVQEVAADTFTVSEEQCKLPFTQEPVAVSTLSEQPKVALHSASSPQHSASSVKVKWTSRGRVNTTRNPVSSCSGDCTLHDAHLCSPLGPSLTSSDNQNLRLQDNVQRGNQPSAIHKVSSLKNMKNLQRKQQQLNIAVAGISSAEVNNKTPVSPSMSTPRSIADMLKVKQGSRAEDIDHPDTINASPLSQKAQTANLTARAQRLHNTVGVLKILPAGSEPGPFKRGLMVPSLGDSSLFVSNPKCEQPPQHVPKDVASTFRYQDLPCSHEASEAEPEAVLGLLCPLWENQNLRETSSEPCGELKS